MAGAEGKTSSVNIRSAAVSDAAALCAIFAPYVAETAIVFECTPPSTEEFAARIARTLRSYPYLLAEEGGKLLGYAYASAFNPREASRHTAELTIYLAAEAKGRGLGRLLYEALERELFARGVRNVYALVATTETPDEHLDANSLHFHEHLGFRAVGTCKRVAYKFGRYYDLTYMEKLLEVQP